MRNPITILSIAAALTFDDAQIFVSKLATETGEEIILKEAVWVSYITEMACKSRRKQIE